jgi:hypothetical protein
MRWRIRVTPFYGCTVGSCGWWAIKPWSVNCESGGGAVSDNLYGNIETYVPGMSKREQDIAAHKILQSAGYENGWLRWETGCTGWPGP